MAFPRFNISSQARTVVRKAQEAAATITDAQNTATRRTEGIEVQERLTPAQIARRAEKQRQALTGYGASIKIRTSAYTFEETDDLTDDKLDISTLAIEADDQVSDQFSAGMSEQRPEIISLMKFRPIYESSSADNRLNDLGQLMEVNYQVGILQKDIVKQFMDKMVKSFGDADTVDNDSEKLFLKIRKVRNKEINSLANTLSLYSEFEGATKKLKNRLNPKKVGSNRYQTGKNFALKNFYTNIMQFDDDHWDRFTNTKVYMQLLSDYRAMAMNHSYALLNTPDSDRKKHYDPVTIDDTHNVHGLKNFRSDEILKLASKPEFFYKFWDHVPDNTSDALSWDLHFLGKELTVSKRLGDDNLNKYGPRYSIQDHGNPFDNILGRPGDTIFDEIVGENSLASMAQFKVPSNPDLLVMPFEGKILDIASESKSYVPGWDFFSDSLLKIKNTKNPKFDKTVLRSYVDTFNKNTASGTKTMRWLLSTNTETKQDSPELYRRLLRKFSASYQHMDSGNGTKAYGRDSALMQGLFRLAGEGTYAKKLNLLLFELFMLACIVKDMNAGEQGLKRTAMFENLAVEYNNMKNFQMVNREAKEAEDAGANIDLVNNNNLDYEYYVELYGEKIRRVVYKIFDVDTTGVPNGFSTTSGYGKQTASSTGETSIVFNSGADFSEILKNLVNKIISGDSPSEYTLLHGIIQYAREISTLGEDRKRSGERGDWLLSDGRSRLNTLSTSTQMLLIYNAFFSATRLLGAAKLGQVAGVVVNVKWNTNNVIEKKGIIQYIRDRGLNFNLAKNYAKPPEDTAASTDTSINNALNNSAMSLAVSARRDGINVNAFCNTNAFGTKVVRNASDFDGATAAPVSAPIPFNYWQARAGAAIAAALSNVWGYGNPGSLANVSAAPIRTSRPEAGPFLENMRSSELNKKLLSISQRLQAEEAILENINYLVEVFRDRVVDGWKEVNKTYHEDRLDELIKDPERKGAGNLLDLRMLRNLKNPAQFQTSVYNYFKYKGKLAKAAGEKVGDFNIKEHRFLANESITRAERNAVYRLLTKDKFNRTASDSQNMHILTVGLPKGFMSFFKDRASVGSIDELADSQTSNVFKDKQFDVIKINVHKRLMRFPNLVFEPQQFTFDASLFLLPQDLENAKLARTESYSNMLAKIKLADLSGLKGAKDFDINNLRPVKYTHQKIIDAAGYDQFANATVSDLFQNQLNSHLFSLYIQLMTGMRLTEETFLKHEIAEQGLNKKFANLLLTYMREELGEPIPDKVTLNGKPGDEEAVSLEEILVDENISENVRDVLNVVLNGNMVHKTGFLTNKILAPKMFDRVFHLPVEMDAFSVDEGMTQTTAAGRKAFLLAKTQGLITQNRSDGKYYFGRSRSRTRGKPIGEVVFDDLFITVENIS